MAVPTFSVVDFDKFQHYKDRSPPWIKLYNDKLDDYEFARLSDAARFHLLAIMLLASRSENKIPYDPVWVSGRINSTETVQLDVLVSAGFIVLNQPLQSSEQAASVVLASCLPRERGEERQSRVEKKDGAEAPVVDLFPKPDSPPSEEKSYFDRSVEILGPKGRGLAAKLLKAKNRVTSDARSVIEVAATKSDPASYIGGAIQNQTKRSNDPMSGYGDEWG